MALDTSRSWPESRLFATGIFGVPGDCDEIAFPFVRKRHSGCRNRVGLACLAGSKGVVREAVGRGSDLCDHLPRKAGFGKAAELHATGLGRCRGARPCMPGKADPALAGFGLAGSGRALIQR